MKLATFSRLAAVFIALQLSFPVLCAEIAGEILLQPQLEGYKVVTAKQGIANIMEMVPQAESTEDWTEMLTTQQFDGMKVPPQKLRSAMADELHGTCEGGESRSIGEGDENGYEVTVWLQMCPLNPATGKPEYTWLKAIQGNEKFYLMQKAFRFEPSEEQIRQWTQYLEDSFLCEARSSDHPCPKF